jgi:hypothetical protein
MNNAADRREAGERADRREAGEPAAPFRVVKGDATAEEVAAITAALSLVLRERAQAAAVNADGQLSEWVRAGRLTARRAGLQRGPWRLSGRVGRRSRA